MKIRQGFVSNSSSSSFIIACKGDLTTELEKLKVKKDELFANVHNEFIDLFISRSEEIEYTLKNKTVYDEDDEKETDKNIVKAVSDGWTVYRGSIYNDNGDVENALCDIGVNYKSDTLFIEKHGGY